MIVYQALSTYQILECIEHRKCFHGNEDAVLILGTYIVEKFPHYRKIVEYKFFDDVYLFNFGGVYPDKDRVIETMESRLKETIPFELSQTEKIYIAGIHTYLSVYLIEKKIRFSMFEDGSGALSRPWVLAEITQKSAPEKYKLINEYGLYDHTSELIDEKWCNQKTQLEGFRDEKIKHFDIVDGFQKLEEDDKQHILDFFNVSKKISVPEDCTLVLTQQFSNLGQLSFEEHIKIYQYLFDFYLNSKNENIVLKLHPDDILYYKKLFPGVRVVREMFPSELLPYVFEQIPYKIATISSTGIHLIRDKFEEHLEFNPLYEKTFVNDPLYYATVGLLKDMGATYIDCSGMNQVQFDNMLQCNIDHEIYASIRKADDRTRTILVIDDHEESIMTEIPHDIYDAVVYLNSLRKYKMFNLERKEVFKDLMPLEISLNPIETDDNEQKNSFVIWVHPLKDEVKEMLENYEVEKELKSTRVTLNVRSFSKEELEIMRLKGLLEATERRLSDYISREKEMRSELKRLRR